MTSTLVEVDDGEVPRLEISAPDSILIEVIGAVGPKGDPGTPGDVGPAGPSGVVIVNHGVDPNVARPASVVVYWKGTADPVNAISTDWWDNT